MWTKKPGVVFALAHSVPFSKLSSSRVVNRVWFDCCYISKAAVLPLNNCVVRRHTILLSKFWWIQECIAQQLLRPQNLWKQVTFFHGVFTPLPNSHYAEKKSVTAKVCKIEKCKRVWALLSEVVYIWTLQLSQKIAIEVKITYLQKKEEVVFIDSFASGPLDT